MIRAFLVMASLALAALPPAASAQDYKAALVNQGALTVGTSGSAPPFSMTTPTGDLDGFDIEVARRLGEALDLEVNFEKLDFAGLLPGLASGRFDIIASGVTRTPERLASTDFFLLSPYIVNGVAVTRRAGEDDVTGWATVCGKVMGAVRGGTFQKIAMEKLPGGLRHVDPRVSRRDRALPRPPQRTDRLRRARLPRAQLPAEERAGRGHRGS